MMMMITYITRISSYRFLEERKSMVHCFISCQRIESKIEIAMLIADDGGGAGLSKGDIC